jgi:hypothetical protein
MWRVWLPRAMAGCDILLHRRLGERLVAGKCKVWGSGNEEGASGACDCEVFDVGIRQGRSWK